MGSGDVAGRRVLRDEALGTWLAVRCPGVEASRCLRAWLRGGAPKSRVLWAVGGVA